MAVQSRNNVLVPLARNDDRGRPYFALFNTLAGSIEVVDQDVADAIVSIPGAATKNFVPIEALGSRSGSASSPVMPVGSLDYLSRRGYLFESRGEEVEQSRSLYRELLRFHRETSQQPIVVIPSYNCNLRCPYCWQRLYHMDSPVMSEELVEHLFTRLPSFIEMASPDKVALTIFGGEPLRDDPEQLARVSQILELGRRAGYTNGIITNGVALAAALPHIRGKVDVLQLTLDGPPEVHRKRRPLPGRGDSFTPTAEGITRALEAGIRVRVRVNTDTTNLERLPELAEIVRQRGWLDSGLIYLHLAPVKNHNPRKDSPSEVDLLRRILDLYARDERMQVFDLAGFAGMKYFAGFRESGLFSLHRFFNCEAQINCWVFDLHGDVYACWDSAGIPDLAVGRFHPEVEIVPEKLARWRSHSALDIEECQDCASAPHCGGGCQFLAWELTGRFDAPACDSLMEGYAQAMRAHSDWLVDRALAGDHCVGLVAREGVLHPVTDLFGVIRASETDLTDAIGCG